MPPLEVRHYESPLGNDPIAGFLDGLPKKAAAKCTVVIGWLGSGDLDQHPNACERARGDIWELKVRHDDEHYRFLYTVKSGAAWILAAIHKKTPKLQESDIKRAQTRLKDLQERGLIP